MRSIALLCVLGYPAGAQQAGAPPRFEVASVKVAAQDIRTPGTGELQRGCNRPPPGMVRCVNATLKQMLMLAYGVKEYQIEGPAWIDSNGYNVMAKVPAGAPAAQVSAMLQALLEERFAVTLHKERRILPAYELTVAKDGPKLKEVDTAKLPALFEPGRPPSLPPPGAKRGGPQPLSRMPAGTLTMRSNPQTGSRMVRGNLTIAELIDVLDMALDRPVLDHTGLTGTYEVELSYAVDETDPMIARMERLVGPMPSLRTPPKQEASTPVVNLFQALQQTLGLKLDSKKGPIETIVIDHANKVPTAN
ncbi:MAG: TIGR03435 family protein [Acidobacteriia bacterium]|nr:TIGR03435 family protein [Terriglobia bacterium]